MAEPTTRATELERLFPWLLHWSITDERIGGFRSAAYALETADGWLLVDPLPLEPPLEAELRDVCGIVMTHGNHQRSCWRLRRELGVRVFAPSASTGLDEQPDERLDAPNSLPGDVQVQVGRGFHDACYLGHARADGTRVAFVGDLICQDPGGPYRFPVQPDYFELEGGREDTRRLLELRPDVLCAAHALPIVEGASAALKRALDA